MEAQERLGTEEERDQFAREFLTCQALYEFLEPETGFTSAQRGDYRWVAKVYQSVQPAMTPDALLWQRLGAKTHELIAKHIGEIEVGKGGPQSIVLDEESLEQLKLPASTANSAPSRQRPRTQPRSSTRSVSGSSPASQITPRARATARSPSASSPCASPTSRRLRRASSS
jgi:hypothetical protein